MVRSGGYVFQVGLFADSNLSPSNLGEAFDYYSAVPGWGWRAIAHAADGEWKANRVVFGASRGDEHYALIEPESPADSYFPAGEAVSLIGGGVAFEGGVALPPGSWPAITDVVSVWLQVEDERGTHGAGLRFGLRENESWDALCPDSPVATEMVHPLPSLRWWSPFDERIQPSAGDEPIYAEPARPGIVTTLEPATQALLDTAQEEAKRLGRAVVGGEDLLLGLLRLDTDPATLALAKHGVTLPAARAAVEFLSLGRAGAGGMGEGMLPEGKKALQLAGDEARRLGDKTLAPRHVLLGLLRQNGTAVRAINWLGVDDEARERLRVALMRNG